MTLIPRLSLAHNSGNLYTDHIRQTPAAAGLTFVHKLQSALIFSPVVFQNNFINPSIFLGKLRKGYIYHIVAYHGLRAGVCIFKALLFIELPSKHTLNNI